MAKKKSRTKNGSAVRVITIAVIVIIILGALFYAYKKFSAPDPAGISATLQDSSELTTQKMIYNGLLKTSSGTIPLINKDEFLVKYKATIRAGFSLEDIKPSDITVTDDAITVTVPHAKVFEVNIDPNDVEFINTDFALIRADKNETAAAAAEAKKDAEKYAKSNGSDLLAAADDNSANIIKGLLSSEAHGRKIVVKYK